MSSYISTFSNRLYTALEAQFGNPSSITSANRISTVQLLCQQVPVPVRRQDKTGSRTFAGMPPGLRTETSFQLRTYMSSWSGAVQPAYGPLFQAAFGATPQTAANLTVSSVSGNQIQTSAPHGLNNGSGVSFGGEIRFVVSVIDQSTFQLNVAFTIPPGAGSVLDPCISYKLASALPSVSIFEYWSPSDAISRIVSGAAVNQFQLNLNSDFHEFLFAGPACDVLDSVTFGPGTGGLTAFPSEPALATFDTSIVPGHLGQVWLGPTPTQFFSLTAGRLTLLNHVQMRANELGATKPLAVVPGPRQVELDLSLFAYDDAATSALYAAGKSRAPISVMFQLGQQPGSLMAVYAPTVTPDVPVFDSTDVRLQWQFRNCLASGVSDDELFLAFA